MRHPSSIPPDMELRLCYLFLNLTVCFTWVIGSMHNKSKAKTVLIMRKVGMSIYSGKTIKALLRFPYRLDSFRVTDIIVYNIKNHQLSK
jgi:hypothetical protein